MRMQRPQEQVWIFALLIYLCLIYLPFIISRSESTEGFLQGDSFYYRAVIDSLLEDGDLVLGDDVADPLNGQLAIGIDGFVPKHPIILSLVSLPFYFLFQTPGLLLFNIIQCMILIVLIFKLNSLFQSHLIAFITTILYATGTLFLDYSYNYSPDLFSTMLVLGGLYFVLRRRFSVGAFLLGLSIFAKLPNALLAGLILPYAAWMIWRGEGSTQQEHVRKRILTILTTALFFILALAPFAYTNYRLFGSPLVTGYQRTAVASADGQMLLVDHTDKFNQPLLKGIYITLFDPRNGVIPTNPVLLLSLLGIIRIRQINPQDKVYLILLVGLAQFLLFAKYDEWFTSHFSNRFLMTFVALSSVFAGNFLSYLSQKYSLEDAFRE